MTAEPVVDPFTLAERACVVGADASLRHGGVCPEPQIHLFVEDWDPPYVGCVRTRPYRAGEDAVAQSGRWASQPLRSKLRRCWWCGRPTTCGSPSTSRASTTTPWCACSRSRRQIRAALAAVHLVCRRDIGDDRCDAAGGGRLGCAAIPARCATARRYPGRTRSVAHRRPRPTRALSPNGARRLRR